MVQSPNTAAAPNYWGKDMPATQLRQHPRQTQAQTNERKHSGEKNLHNHVIDLVYPADSHSVNVLNYAWFYRPPVREAEPVQNLLGDSPGSIRQNRKKRTNFWPVTSSFFSGFYKAVSDF
jgi:hypothetical protein